ncbi:MAG: hypothetical protein UV54_C0028G0006 [Candidatus Beckwithbacteria bacterium GW2011_GWA2_43_10]|uniref:Uncharacterized protein n=1 Tax=Candidatus Beckwithbacteria bacterium GW2011_GWA2_43_10 TaxID=1618369 RepID=A0A0G1EYR6_9BACT|nr:MAG: hypothetical protein UV54_C0028G0006 [Candidatus Beckwithbacteria bacterium GW2011_GWA2_43_10]
MLDGSDIEIIKEVKKEGERTELNGIRVDWQEEDSEYLPTKINGEQVRTQVWYVDAKEIEPRRSLLKRLQPITSGNVREVLRRNAWGEVLSLMTNWLAVSRHDIITRQIRDEYILAGKSGESVKNAEIPQFETIWKEAFLDTVNYWKGLTTGKRLRVIQLDGVDRRYASTMVKTYEIIGGPEDSQRRFEAAIIGFRAARYAQQLTGKSADMRTEIVILPEVIETKEEPGLRICSSELGQQDFLNAGGFYDIPTGLQIIFPGSAVYMTRWPDRWDLTGYQHSLIEVIYHETGHKFHLLSGSCPSAIVKEGVAQVCGFAGLRVDAFDVHEVHERVAKEEVADIHRMARIMEKEFKMERDEFGLTGDAEVDNLTTREIYYLSGSLFWLINCLEKPGKDRVIKFAQFIRLISGYDGLDREGKYTRLSSLQQQRERQINTYGVTFIGGSLAKAVQKVYGKNLDELGRLWQKAVRESL